MTRNEVLERYRPLFDEILLSIDSKPPVIIVFSGFGHTIHYQNNRMLEDIELDSDIRISDLIIVYIRYDGGGIQPTVTKGQGLLLDNHVDKTLYYYDYTNMVIKYGVVAGKSFHSSLKIGNDYVEKIACYESIKECKDFVNRNVLVKKLCNDFVYELIVESLVNDKVVETEKRITEERKGCNSI